MLITLLLSLLAFLVYRFTSYPGISWVDSGVIAAAASSLGISNPPGFPLYMLIAKVFTFLPIGDVGSRLQILSHLGAILLLISVYIFVKRITGKVWPAVFSFVALAFSYNLWSQAGNIETFTLTNGLMYLFLLWVLEVDPRDSKKVLLAGFVGGGFGRAQSCRFGISTGWYLVGLQEQNNNVEEYQSIYCGINIGCFGSSFGL